MNLLKCLAAAGIVSATILTAHAEIDGHGPDAWRVTGVAPSDTLNARMGPGTQYPVIEEFAHDERGLRQITCVPYLTASRFMEMTEAERAGLPPRWCLMQDASMTRAGWVAQRYITPDESGGDGAVDWLNDAAIEEARQLVAALYDAQARADRGADEDPLFSPEASRYFSNEILDYLDAGQIDAHPLYGAQDFEGRVRRVVVDSERSAARGAVLVQVDFINFGQEQHAMLAVRPETNQAGAPLRIFHIEHDGWQIP